MDEEERVDSGAEENERDVDEPLEEEAVESVEERDVRGPEGKALLCPELEMDEEDGRGKEGEHTFAAFCSVRTTTSSSQRLIEAIGM